MRAVWALFSLVLVAGWTGGGEARVKLNSIRTIVLRETHALPPVNRSAGPVTGADFAKVNNNERMRKLLEKFS